jgi:hypothetical protein
LLRKYNLDLNGEWNKVLIPHKGRHPNMYHEWILENLRDFDLISLGDTNKFLELFNEIKSRIIKNPDMLGKSFWD